MATIIKTLLACVRSKKGEQSPESEEGEVTLDDDQDSEKPYIINSIYYLSIIILIGVPMWFYTCSSTRYALPDLTQFESKLAPPGPRLHLDISVVQLADASNRRDPDKEKQSDYLRDNLPGHLKTSIQGLVYNLNWRIRRPTQEETQVMKSLLKENEKSTPPATSEQRRTIHTKIEENLLRIHKATNRFRLFMYIFEGPLGSLVCENSHTHLINFERFIYICPGEGDESTANLIKAALNETYRDTVDPQRAEKILGAKTDLLVSFIPETEQTSLQNLSLMAEKVHKIHDRNVKMKHLELAGILNIRLITQNLFLLHDDALDKMFMKRQLTRKQPESTNTSESATARVLNNKEMGRFFHDYESRLNKHSSQSVNHVVTLVPDQSKARIVVEQTEAEQTPVQILEERNTNFILVADEDKSLVLGMRAVVRRVVGLKSNLCKNCLVRRDIFINKWELDAIVGALTILKLQSVLVSLRSISQQAIGIKIPQYVSSMAFEAHSLAVESLDHLYLKKPLEAYHAINSAHELSETAFYDPSLLETLYFPDETKYAIYLPLFLPLGFPLVLSLLRIGKYVLSDHLPGSQRKEKLS